MTIHQGLTTEIQKLNPSAVIELFELDATNQGGDVLRFHAGTNELRQNVVWQGETYVRFPISATGFEITGQGQIPRPKLAVSNVLSAITTVLLATNDLMGAKLTRKRTLAKYLDAANFEGGVNPDEDDTAEFPNDIYYIDRKSSEDKDVVEFELSASMDLTGVMLPRRAVIQNICTWQYRGAECGFTGAPLFDINDESISASGHSAEGAAVLNTYQTYLAAQEALVAAETALTAASRSKDADCEIVKLSTQYSVPIPEDDINYAVRVTRTRNDGEKATGAMTGYWDGSLVTLGITYRQGKLKLHVPTADYYEIQQWGINSAICTPSTSAYNTALTARNAAAVARDAALEDFEDAFAALPEDDPLYTADRCGKRLSSCRIRFGENEPLPFGGFPGVGLTK